MKYHCNNLAPYAATLTGEGEFVAMVSNGELRRIYASSSRLTANVSQAQIREMIRRGFFSKGVWLDELDLLESVARQIINQRDAEGRSMLEIDPESWARAKEIVVLGARVPIAERHSVAKISDRQRKSAAARTRRSER